MWTDPPFPLPAPDKAVHLWRASLTMPAEKVQALHAALSSDEQERAARYRVETARDRFVAARGILRRMLGRYLDLEPEEVRFRYTGHGKPEVDGAHKAICFNLAHTRDLALYAFTLGHRVGVDVEHLERLTYTDRMQLARRFFSETEYSMLLALPDKERDRAFLSGWTRKEAFVKATGQGLACPLDQFDVSLAPDQPAALLAVRWNPLEAARWSMMSLDPAPGYTGAVVVEGPLPRIMYWQWTM